MQFVVERYIHTKESSAISKILKSTITMVLIDFFPQKIVI